MDSEDEPRESILGRSADSRRVAQARHRHWRDECEQVVGAPPQPALPNLANLPGEPREAMVSVDFFMVPTIRFQVLYVFLVLAHERRRILHFGGTAHPTAEWTAQQLREAFPWDSAPR